MAIRFVRPSEVITQLKSFRNSINLSDTNFKVFGAAEYEKAKSSGKFVQTANAALYVMVSNSSSSIVTQAGSGVDVITHAIDVVLYHQLQDNRGQYCDEVSVWYKEFILKALFGFEPYEGSEPLQYAGDIFNQTENASSYSRVYQISQQTTLDQTDRECCGSYDDLDDFTQLYNTINAVTPDFDDIATTELDIQLETE